MLSASVLGLGFILVELYNLAQFGMRPQEHAYASLIYTVFAFQLIHVAIAVLMSSFVVARSWRGFVTAERPMEVLVTVAFWRYVAVTWMVAFAVVYLFPLVAE